MKFFKRALALFLTLILVLGTLQISAAAITDDYSVTLPDEDNFSVKSTNAVGDLVLGIADGEPADENSDYAIYDLKLTGETANVSLNNKDESVLVVAIYDTVNNQMLGSGKTVVQANANSAEVKINCLSWPEYFIVKAFLLAPDNTARCQSLTCPYYTKEFREFLSKTTDDFDQEEVINLDDDKTNNFIVLADGARTVKATRSKNILKSFDEEKGIYVISNPDDEMQSLKKDSVLHYIYGDGENDFDIISIGSISKSGNTLTITAQSAEIEDLLQHVRIEKKITTDDSKFVDPDDFEAYEQKANNKQSRLTVPVLTIPEVTAGPSFEFRLGDEDDDLLYGTVNLKVSVTLKAYFSLEIKFLDFDTYSDFKFVFKTEAEFQVGANGKVEGSFDLKNINIPVFAGINVEGDPKLVVSLSAKVYVRFTAMKESGGTFKTGEGQRSINESESSCEPNFESEVEGKIGLHLDLALEFIEILEAGGAVEFGIKLSVIPFTRELSPDVKHLCPFCLSGELGFYSEFEIKLTVGIDEFAGISINKEFDLIKIALPEIEVPIIDEFYVTNITGRFEWHLGSCPHFAYKVTFTVTDSEDKPISGAKIGKLTTNSKGVVSEFYEDGTSEKFTVTADGYKDGSTSFKINKKPLKLTIVLYAEDEEEPENPDDPDDPDDPIVGNVGWRYDSATKTLYITGSGAMSDYAYLDEAPWHQYYEEIRHIDINKGVTYIGDNAFAQCWEVVDVKIPESVKAIGDYAFYNCSMLQTITLSDTVETVGNYAFYQCYAASDLDLGDGLKTISPYAFAQCTGLDDVLVPASVSSVGYGAFAWCNLKSITFVNSRCTINSSADTINASAVIHGIAGSTAESYANKNNRVFVADIVTASIAEEAMTFDVFSIDTIDEYVVSCNGTIPSEEYVLLVLNKKLDSSALSSDKLLYIDQKISGDNSSISFTYMPRTGDKQYVYLFGKFADGSTAKELKAKKNSAGLVASVDITDDISLNYKNSTTITPTVVCDGTVDYTVKYESSDSSVAQVDENGNVYASGKGNATITCTVTDEFGNTVTDTCDVEVKYTWWQWIIVIVLFGWIWY